MSRVDVAFCAGLSPCPLSPASWAAPVLHGPAAQFTPPLPCWASSSSASLRWRAFPHASTADSSGRAAGRRGCSSTSGRLRKRHRHERLAGFGAEAAGRHKGWMEWGRRRGGEHEHERRQVTGYGNFSTQFLQPKTKSDQPRPPIPVRVLCR